ncbi:hypothetical protein JCM8097_008798 [Rhodosporidiobolus ruineniae]
MRVPAGAYDGAEAKELDGEAILEEEQLVEDGQLADGESLAGSEGIEHAAVPSRAHAYDQPSRFDLREVDLIPESDLDADVVPDSDEDASQELILSSDSDSSDSSDLEVISDPSSPVSSSARFNSLHPAEHASEQEHDAAAAHPLHPFPQAAGRSARARTVAPSAPLKSPRRAAPPFSSSFDLSQTPSDHPLPAHTFPFDILNFAPQTQPGPPPGYGEPSGMSSEERAAMGRRERVAKDRMRAQRKMKEGTGEGWEWEWELQYETREDGKGKGKEERAWRAVEFFPFANHDGMGYMEGVFAVCGGNEVHLLRVPRASSSSAPYEILAVFNSPIPASSPDPESYLALSWSVNLSTPPYTPMLAVAGRGRVTEILLVGQRKDGGWVVHHERTVVGHGGPINHLRFHPSRPHLLASCSADRTIRLIDATLPWGSNAAMVDRMRLDLVGEKGKNGKGKKGEEGTMRRRRVVGEVLGVANEGGHKEGVLCCDFHPTLPLLVSSGQDDYIHLWRLPPSLLESTPTFPTSSSTPVYRHPSSPLPLDAADQPPSLPPPLFSSLSVHSGPYPSFVRFLAPHSAQILSYAPKAHGESKYGARKSVKVWTPSCLDRAPDREERRRGAEREHEHEHGRASSALALREDGTEGKTLAELLAKLHPPPQLDEGLKLASSTAFRVDWEAELEGLCCVGDGVGYYRPRATEEGEEGVREPVLVVPTTAPYGVRDEKGEGDGLFFFRPSAPHSPPPNLKSPSSMVSGSTSTSRLPSQSLSRSRTSSSMSRSRDSTPSSAPSRLPHSLSASGSSKPAQHRAEKVHVLFPPDRDRLSHDFTPRLLPSSVAPLPPPSLSSLSDAEKAQRQQEAAATGEGVGRARHVRAVAVDPSGAGAVVAVGEGAMIGVWRLKRRDKDGEEGE